MAISSICIICNPPSPIAERQRHWKSGSTKQCLCKCHINNIHVKWNTLDLCPYSVGCHTWTPPSRRVTTLGINNRVIWLCNHSITGCQTQRHKTPLMEWLSIYFWCPTRHWKCGIKISERMLTSWWLVLQSTDNDWQLWQDGFSLSKF